MDRHQTGDNRAVALRRVQRIIGISNPNVAGSLAHSHLSSNSSRGLLDRAGSSVGQTPYVQHAAAMQLWWSHARDAVLDLTKEVEEQVRVQAAKLLTLQLARTNTFTTPPRYDVNGWRMNMTSVRSPGAGGAKEGGGGHSRLAAREAHHRSGRIAEADRGMEFRRRVRAAFLSGSNDGCQAYRTVCLKALGQVCKTGDEEVLLCLGGKLGDASDDARKEACNALARLGADRRVLVPGQVDWSKRDNVRKQFELESALWAHVQDAARRRQRCDPR